MLLHLPQVLSEAQVARCRELMERAKWVDGRVTAGHQSAKAKHNLQIAEGTPEAREMGEMIVLALERNRLFVSAALPQRVFPPLFNRYEPGMNFGAHVDNAIRQAPRLDGGVTPDGEIEPPPAARHAARVRCAPAARGAGRPGIRRGS